MGIKEKDKKEITKICRECLEVFRKEPFMVSPEDVEGLLKSVKAGIRADLFTLKSLGTSKEELLDFSRMFITH